MFGKGHDVGTSSLDVFFSDITACDVPGRRCHSAVLMESLVIPPALRSRVRRAAMIGVSLATVVGAPLAVAGTSTSAHAATIAGAHSLTDKVSVTYQKPKNYGTTDVHVIAWNDFHGNLDPGTLNIY